jgi:antirestriction protein
MDSPKIYVASLSDYNNGRLEGRWFDFSDYSNASDLMQGIQEMLDELNQKYNDGEIREEWAVHDYEYIPSSLASEYMGEKDFEEIYNIMEVAENIGIPMEVLMERVSDTGNDDLRSVADSLMFVVDGNDESDIVYELEEQIGDLGFDFWQNHIYIDDVTKRVMYGEDVDRYRDDILSDNPDLDEDEVERMAEEQADEEESHRDNDLIGYLKEMGYEDIPSWVSKDYESAWNSALSYDYDVINHDGEMYVFSNSYAQGGRTMEVSEYDLERIKQAVREAQMEENKGKFNPSDAQQFIKDNPQLLMMLKKGGKIDNDENYEMLKSKVKELMHHSKELETIIKTKQETPAWVVAKSTRASTDLSDITHYMDGKKFAKGGGVDEEMHFFVVNNKDDKNYNRVGYVIDETIKDNKGNEFEKLYFENKKLPKKYNVNDLIYLQQRSNFTQKDKYSDGETDFVILVEYESSPKPYYYLYNVTKKFVATEGSLDWVKSSLPKGWKFYDSYAKGGGIRKMKLYDAVLYNGKQYDISKKNGIVGLKNLSQGAWGSDYPFIPLYKVDINNVTDMYGNKVEISKIYENGGGVGFREEQINDLNSWDNDEIANFLGVSSSQVAKDRQRYIREAQSVMMLDSYGEGGGIGFKGLANKVAKRYEGKSVAPKYQDEYGKRYSKSEAQEVGRKVAGKVYYQQQGRKFDNSYAKGGMTEHGLEIGDEIMGYTKKVNELHVINRKNDEWHSVDLDDGRRYEDGGNINGLSDLIYG